MINIIYAIVCQKAQNMYFYYEVFKVHLQTDQAVCVNMTHVDTLKFVFRLFQYRFKEEDANTAEVCIIFYTAEWHDCSCTELWHCVLFPFRAYLTSEQVDRRT